MPSILPLVKTLSKDFPSVNFAPGDRFLWSPSEVTVFYEESSKPEAPALLLHELGHALLNHTSYQRDIELLAMETSAWEKATELATQYSVAVSENDTEDHLDTYREWLHARSSCPNCTANGFQTARTTYSCPACAHTWRVNEARLCALRRYSA